MYLVFMNSNMEPGFLQSSYKVPTKTFCHMFCFFLTYYTQKKNLVCWPHRFHYFFWQGLHWSRSRHKQHFLIFIVFGKKKEKKRNVGGGSGPWKNHGNAVENKDLTRLTFPWIDSGEANMLFFETPFKLFPDLLEPPPYNEDTKIEYYIKT